MRRVFVLLRLLAVASACALVPATSRAQQDDVESLEAPDAPDAAEDAEVGGVAAELGVGRGGLEPEAAGGAIVRCLGCGRRVGRRWRRALRTVLPRAQRPLAERERACELARREAVLGVEAIYRF